MKVIRPSCTATMPSPEKRCCWYARSKVGSAQRATRSADKSTRAGAACATSVHAASSALAASANRVGRFDMKLPAPLGTPGVGAGARAKIHSFDKLDQISQIFGCPGARDRAKLRAQQSSCRGGSPRQNNRELIN